MKKICPQCLEDPFIFDLRDYPNNFYKPGEVMFGDLDVLGWVLVRGIRISPESHMGSNKIAELGPWNPIEKSERCMKYKLGTHVPPAWKTDMDVATVMNSIQTELIDKVLNENGGNYRMWKYNLLKNKANIWEDQMPHYDYPNQFDSNS